MCGRITFSLIFLAAFSSHCLAQCPKDPVRLEAFTGFVSINTQLRFQVTSISVGKRSVYDLFRDPNTVQTSWRNGGYFREIPRRLMIKSGADLEELHEALLQEDEAILKVSLADHHLMGWSRIPGLGSAIYNYDCAITVLLPACDRRTRLIYTQVSKLTREQMRMEGETTLRLEVGEAFYKLLNEEMEEYMKTLSPSEEGPCVNEIELQKFLETKGRAGFASAGYQLSEGLKSFLNLMTVAMRNVAQGWSQYHLDVKIVGHADRDKVGKIDLLTTATGVDEDIWRYTPFKIYFGGCNKNRLIKDSEPYYFDFVSQAQGSPIKTITNNCELGAVRAYVAAAYLRSKFDTDPVSYSYATGGSRSINKNGPANPVDRRIDMEFTMKGARGVK